MPRHVVIDGSNLATEGRSMPSLKQLVEAVGAFMAEHPTALITVVVDATFGHRIDPREVPEFDAAIDHNELVAPPAGAVGRGDAFVLAIADKVDAAILSNDSYQEFHGDYPWLFDEGRLIGGKPVPHVGWVFVPRVPVRGPLSRRSQREAKQKDRTEKATVSKRASKAASQPLPVPTAPPPGAVVPAKASGRSRKREAAVAAPAPAPKVDGPTPAKSTMVNELIPFITFVEHHPVGTTVTAVVESYSSHGAYVTVGDARAYIPLRYMADPPPRSARELMKVGEEVSLVVVAFHASRRGIDLALPSMAPAIAPASKAGAATPASDGAEGAPAPTPPAPAKRARRTASKAADAEKALASEEPVAAKPSGRRRKDAAGATSAQEAAPSPDPAAPPAPSEGRARRTASKATDADKAPVSEEPVATTPAGRRRKGAATPASSAAAPPAATPPDPAPAKRARRTASKATTVEDSQVGEPPVPAKATRRASSAKSGTTAGTKSGGAPVEPAGARPAKATRAKKVAPKADAALA